MVDEPVAESDGRRLAFEWFGYVAEVVSDERALLERVAPLLPPGWQPHRTGPVQATFEVTADGAIMLDGAPTPRPSVWRNPLSDLAAAIDHHLAQHAPAHVFVHAGVVTVGGVAIVIPGRSMSGKSTLVDALLHAGALYYSDDYAVVDAEGLIHPFPKPLSLRADPGRGEPGGLLEVPEDRIGREPIRAGLIAVTSYEPGAVWGPKPMAAGEGALALLEHTVVARSRPRESVAAACLLADNARIVSGPRGEAGPVARALVRLAES